MKRILSTFFIILLILLSCGKKDKMTNGGNNSGGNNNGGGTNPPVGNSQHISVTTQHNDNDRTGWNDHEALLDTSNVNPKSFGKLFSLSVDDQVYAQPLVVGGLQIDTAVHNVLFVATVNNSVYAFDGDNGNLFWAKNFTKHGMRAPQNTDMGSCGGLYTDFTGKIGIVGTPVIDSANRTIYFVARSTDGTNYVQYLHALNLMDGTERPGSPVQITASIPGDGDGSVNHSIVFNGKTQNQRQGLTLVNGRIYISWSSHCDIGPYHGWILGYNAATLQQEIVYNDTPGGSDGGIWESGMGLCADGAGNLFASVGNGTVGVNNNPNDVTNLAECAVKLTPAGNSLQVASYFIPYNYSFLNSVDLDLGSLGSILIPNSNYFFTGCKDGSLFLLDGNNMGGYNASSNQIRQGFSLNNGSATEHCQAAYFKGTSSEFVYVWSENDQLKAFPFNRSSNLFDLGNTITSTISGPTGESGAVLSISSNGNAAGSGILWAVFPFNCDANHNDCPGVIYAFDASNITRQLWNSSTGGLWKYAKFSSPTVANGHLYVATFSGTVDVYGPK